MSLALMVFSSRVHLPTKKDGTHVINLHDKQGKETYWVSLFIYRNTAGYIDSFGIEYIPQEVLYRIKDKFISHNIFRIQDEDSIMCGFYCIDFIEYALQEKLCYIITIHFLLKQKMKILSMLKTNMVKENFSLVFRQKNRSNQNSFRRTKTWFNEWKAQKVWRISNYFEHLVFVSAVSGCVYFCICLISRCFHRYCEFCSRIKNFINSCRNIKLVIKKKKKKHNKIVLLAKPKLNSIFDL